MSNFFNNSDNDVFYTCKQCNSVWRVTILAGYSHDYMGACPCCGANGIYNIFDINDPLEYVIKFTDKLEHEG